MNRIKLKICGVRSAEEAHQLMELGVDYVGLNFVPTSINRITIETAETIVSVLKDSPVQVVSLFQNQPLALVNEYSYRLQADYVQLHGDELADYVRSVERPVMRAIPVSPAANARELINYIAALPPAYFVLDRAEQGRGTVIPSVVASEVVASYPDKIFLAGGLNVANLTTILQLVTPWGIDIASGVRTEGRLDVKKVERCLEILNPA